MKKVITVLAAVWVFGVFAFLQMWFWSSVSSGHGSALINAAVGVFVFLAIGVAPVKIIKMIANIFK